ncbi:MAG: choice-of-anchor L domain-containing protein, partial [Myxococcota bacterium]
SNTIQGQFSQGGAANDYTEVRIQATVPPTSNSLSYDFAFFSTEYPFYFGSAFNDMYIGWLESESWTGNVSFDNQGNPISLNAGFLDFRDDGGTMAPELAGTCMKRHAGTRWLSSTAPVTPSEEITLVLAVFDLSDSILDSYVFIDNFGWGCDGTSTPETVPVG